jgi:hypothetical protein
LFLFLQWKPVNSAAFHAAAAMVFCIAFLTLDKKQMAAVILTIGVGVARLTALMAM